ncbi:uncharacterized protein ATNIH1004_006740 [Aspergillus tanneri]|uniref:Uncharacterized protein n=1 Tax=Aspergillus tanneri TaxID=1220188 RepID=A0A5M9MEF9_9EURO|nr:uncharacterized protein ATNIH1004_006740 [Aspergillus tanneri]KAA8645321.1 hypothetical protein ATNIH1004_006740 [Aspergillus tanneri]
MANTTFHINTFIPWNPPPRKPHLSRNSYNNSRRANPVSIINCPTLPQPPHYGPSAKKAFIHHQEKQHPLPARPPNEVCVHSSIRSCTPLSSDRRFREEHIPVSDGPHEDNPLNVFAASQAQEHRHSSPTPSAAPQVDFRDAADGSVESPPSIQSTVEGDSSSDSNILPHIAGSPYPDDHNQQLRIADDRCGQGEHDLVNGSDKSTISRKRPSNSTKREGLPNGFEPPPPPIPPCCNQLKSLSLAFAPISYRYPPMSVYSFFHGFSKEHFRAAHRTPTAAATFHLMPVKSKVQAHAKSKAHTCDKLAPGFNLTTPQKTWAVNTIQIAARPLRTLWNAAASSANSSDALAQTFESNTARRSEINNEGTLHEGSAFEIVSACADGKINTLRLDKLNQHSHILCVLWMNEGKRGVWTSQIPHLTHDGELR